MNGWVDSLLAATNRLLELPFFALFATAAVLALGLWIVLRRAIHRRASPAIVRGLQAGLVALPVLLLVLLLDRRIARLQNELDTLRGQSGDQAMALLGTIRAHGVTRASLLFDAPAAEAALREHFDGVGLRAVVSDDATDLVQVHASNPLLHAVLAVVDLRFPGLQIVLGADLETKTLTSEFARAHACTLAINGEAGDSPRAGSGFGRWRGNMVRCGARVMEESAGQPRPFLSFDRANHAVFTPAGAAGRALPADAFNVIWGRVDAIVAGEMQTTDFRFNEPRTAMGIDRDGERLYLLVVDGRQPQRSWGVTRAQAGQILQAFGVHDAMLCDEGGSSCMYVEQLGGLGNVPSDNHGEERPTYTHFGIALRHD